MQAQVLVGPITPITGSDVFSSIINNSVLISIPGSKNSSNRRRTHSLLVVESSSSSWAAAVNGEPDHCAVLGVVRSAMLADIKRAYRLFARKVLSNEVTRIKYDRALKFQRDTVRSHKEYSSYSPDFEDRVRMYNRSAELRKKLQYERCWKRNNSNKEYSSFAGETTDDEAQDES